MPSLSVTTRPHSCPQIVPDTLEREEYATMSAMDSQLKARCRLQTDLHHAPPSAATAFLSSRDMHSAPNGCPITQLDTPAALIGKKAAHSPPQLSLFFLAVL